MTIIIGIIQSFLSATGMILTKKILENKVIGNNLQTFVNRGYHLIIVGVLFLIGFFDYNISGAGLVLYDYIILIIASIAIYITYYLRRTAYSNEKVSVLQPYAMLFQVFPIIIGFFFIASERANLITFISALTASFIVILSSINIKKFKINKYSMMVLASSIIKSFQVFAVLYFLTKINPASFYFTETIVILTISVILMLFKKEFSQIKLITKTYAKLLIFANSIIVVSILLALTMYANLGVVLTSLISLLYLIFVYILGYFILKEVPSKKDILVAILVAICIIIGVIFKT